MSKTIRIAALLGFAAAGCISNDEIAQTSPAAAQPVSFFAENHAAIPASKDNGNFFEYN